MNLESKYKAFLSQKYISWCLQTVSHFVQASMWPASVPQSSRYAAISQNELDSFTASLHSCKLVLCKRTVSNFCKNGGYTHWSHEPIIAVYCRWGYETWIPIGWCSQWYNYTTDYTSQLEAMSHTPTDCLTATILRLCNSLSMCQWLRKSGKWEWVRCLHDCHSQ